MVKNIKEGLEIIEEQTELNTKTLKLAINNFCEQLDKKQAEDLQETINFWCNQICSNVKSCVKVVKNQLESNKN